MKEEKMAKLIDADKIADYVCDKCGAVNCDRNPTYCVERDFIVACAKEMPEAVVRCKDCKWWKEETEYEWDGETVLTEHLCTKHDFYIKSDDYCAWGEAKMADKLISANALGEQVERLIKPKSTEAACVFGEVLALIEDAPSVDAVPVVRCKDCAHRGWEMECPIEDRMGDDFFCAWGERREDGEE